MRQSKQSPPTSPDHLGGSLLFFVHHFDVKRGCVADLKYARVELRLFAREITFGEPASNLASTIVLYPHAHAHALSMSERDKGAGDPR